MAVMIYKTFTTIAVLLTLSLQAIAQVPTSPGPPPKESSLTGIVIAIVITIILAYGTFRSAKRSHQD